MTLLLLRILQHRFQVTKYFSYPIHLLSISNECTLGVEKYVWNVMSSHGVVALNAFNMLWSCSNIVLWCESTQIGGKKFREKWKCKVRCTDLQNTSKETSESLDIEYSQWCRGRVEVYPVTLKRRGNSVWFDWECQNSLCRI